MALAARLAKVPLRCSAALPLRGEKSLRSCQRSQTLNFLGEPKAVPGAGDLHLRTLTSTLSLECSSAVEASTCDASEGETHGTASVTAGP